LGGWCWREVASRLGELGREVHPATLTGLGERVHLATPTVDLETHIADVVNLLDYRDLHGVVLVGHSYAGAVITGVADRRPARLDALVYLDSSPLPNGTAIVDIQTAQQREQQRVAVERHGDGWRWPLPDRETLARGTFGSVGGLSEEHFGLIERLGSPQPYATFTSALRLTGELPPELRRVEMLGSQGGPGVAALRALIAEGDPRAAPFAEPGWEFYELATGHWAMLSAPDALSRLLHRIAA
jgi:pimeloyl-ACP methyl ester carboxylesterase